ncbi:hypothetical protein [Sphingomonas sp. CCH9-F2]|jgi:hypothetical protein|nr:hypothetical protein [Sphingomonas sp. CCH9-F2]
MKLAALLLATILLAGCEGDPSPAPSPGATSANYVDNDPRWPDGAPK